MPTTLPASTGEELSNERKSQIKSFKEMFPQYRSCTNDDILAIFAEFNNNYQSAVYGAMSDLVVYKPTTSWESVDKPSKKKKKTQGYGSSRSASTNPRGGRKDTEQRTDRRDQRDQRDQRDNRSERGRSSSRGQANSGGRGASSSRSDDRRKATQATAPPPTRSEVQKAATPTAAPPAVEKKQAPLPAQKTSALTGAPAWGPAAAASRAKAAAAAAASSTSSVQHPSSASSSSSAQQPAASSYANAAKTRQPWNPAAAKAPAAAAQPKSQAPAPKKPVEQKQVPARQEQAPRKTAPAKEVKPRVGVLLPGGFASEDMSFQFGNLGLASGFGELPSSADERKPAASPSLAPSQAPAAEPKSAPTAPESSDGPAVPPGFSPYSGGPPMGYGMPPFADGEAGMRPPMMNMYYPGGEPARGGDGPANYQRGGAPPAAGAGAPAAYSSGGRGASAAGGENASKFPEGAGGPQAANGPYPGYYGMPYGFPNQAAYPGNSYGNQFYGFRPNYYQGFAGMPYGSHEEDYKARGMSPYAYPPGTASESAPPSGDATSKAPQSGQQGGPEKAGSGAETFGEGYGRGGPEAHYYAQEMYSGFGQQYYPGHMMGQQHYQQPQQPQQGSSAQQPQQGQQSGSRNY